MNIPLNFVYEDDLSECIMAKLVNHFGKKYFVGKAYTGGGYSYIKKNINGFNEAAISTPFFVLTDLDNYECPATLINEWLTRPQKRNLIFRVAVREIESWILADIEGLSEFLGVSKKYFPDDSESIPDPKKCLLELAKRSKKRTIRDDIVPKNSNARVGPNYNGRLMEFIIENWNLENAKKRSSSLLKAFKSLENFKYFNS